MEKAGFVQLRKDAVKGGATAAGDGEDDPLVAPRPGRVRLASRAVRRWWRRRVQQGTALAVVVVGGRHRGRSACLVAA